MVNDKDFCLFVAETIKKHRITLGLSKKELAIKSKLSETSISQIESGKIDPPLYTLYKIAKALNVTLSKLVENE